MNVWRFIKNILSGALNVAVAMLLIWQFICEARRQAPWQGDLVR
jgi:hypothetical protein